MQGNGVMVQDWTRIYSGEGQSAGRTERRRYISNAERIRQQKKRKKLAKKRRRRKLVFAGAITIFLLFMLISGVVTVGKYLFAGTFFEEDEKVFHRTVATSGGTKENGYGKGTLREYEMTVPKKYEGEAIYSRLKELAETYPEFEELYEHSDNYPEELLGVVCSNLEMIDYVKGYPKADRSAAGGFTKEELSGGVPLLIQWDKRWGYAPYGDDNIGLSGCAPVCMSMVIVGLTGDDAATPDRIADFAEQGNHYVAGTGTAWSLMTAAGEPYGVFAQQMGLDRDVIFSTLEAGTPIICSMGEGDFTTSGHFIVLTGVEDGKIRVNDPNSRLRSEKLWDYETLSYQIRNMWAYYRY